MNRKKLITILATITILAILMAPMLLSQFGQVSAAEGYDEDYITVEGVLDSDSYSLYPYNTSNSLKIGFSKYGEMIDSDTNVGLEYGDVDAFAAPVGPGLVTGLPKKYWSQGWLINITYTHKSLGHRNVWAMATFADMVDYDRPWLRVDWGRDDYDDPIVEPGEPGVYGWETPDDPGYEIGGADVLRNGGRKTNGTAVTEPIKVLYDGPRRFVALLNTTIYDHVPTPPDEPLVRLFTTIVFNKVKKEVNLFKDVKSVISFKILVGDMNVQLSNRGQVDLGTETAGFESYAHFYTEGIGIYDPLAEGLSTVYNSEYEMVRTETPCKEDWGVAESGDAIHLNDTDKTDWEDDEWVGYKVAIINGTGAGQIRNINDTGTTGTYGWLEVDEAWDTNPDETSRYVIYNPEICKTADGRFPQDTGATYDLAQAINPDAGYVWSAAFWPSLSDWSIWGWPQQFSSMDALDPHYIDMLMEDEVPYYIGEWDFELGHSTSDNRMFRGVTAYSIVDQHDADDADMGALHTNVIDEEIEYLMDEKFNPFDLYDAVHKDSTRWVEFFTGDGETTSFRLTGGVLSLQTYDPDKADDGWIGWQLDEDLPFRGCKKSIKMMTYNGTMRENHEISTGCAIAYSVDMTVAEFEEFVYHFWLPEGADTSPEPSWPPHMCFYLESALDPGNFSDVSLMPSNIRGEHAAATEEWVEETINGSSPGFNLYGTIPEITDAGTTNELLSFFFDQCPNAKILWITIEFGGWGGTAYDDGTAYVDDVSLNDVDLTPKRGELVYDENSITAEQLGETPEWDEYCSFAERVLVNGTLMERGVNYTIDIAEKDESFWANIYSGDPTLIFDADSIPAEDAVIKVLYSTKPEGSYEWIVVGKDAATIDSAAAAYVTEAFDSIKHIHVQMTGMDINETVYGPYAPFVMGRNNTGTKADYRDTLGRPHLRDDWCHTSPISSSDMIFSAGPRANLGTEYFNEFTMAFYARSEYVVNNTGQANKILALSCWNRTIYGSGYGVISVYKDLNGTIGLVFWGYDGQDLYYTAKWFWDTGIEYLQTENRGVTDIILKITYPCTDPIHPTFSIVERLGTISEKTPHDC